MFNQFGEASSLRNDFDRSEDATINYCLTLYVNLCCQIRFNSFIIQE